MMAGVLQSKGSPNMGSLPGDAVSLVKMQAASPEFEEEKVKRKGQLGTEERAFQRRRISVTDLLCYMKIWSLGACKERC